MSDRLTDRPWDFLSASSRSNGMTWSEDSRARARKLSELSLLVELGCEAEDTRLGLEVTGP